MFIELSRPVQVRCNDGVFTTLPAGTKVNYGSRRNGSSMVHWFHASVKIVHNRIVNHEVITHTTVTPASDSPEWL